MQSVSAGIARPTGQAVSLTGGFRDWTRDQRGVPAGILELYMTWPATGWCGNLPGGLSQSTTAPPADHYHSSPGSVRRKKRDSQRSTLTESSPAIDHHISIYHESEISSHSTPFLSRQVRSGPVCLIFHWILPPRIPSPPSPSPGQTDGWVSRSRASAVVTVWFERQPSLAGRAGTVHRGTGERGGRPRAPRRYCWVRRPRRR